MLHLNYQNNIKSTKDMVILDDLGVMTVQPGLLAKKDQEYQQNIPSV